MLLPDEPEPVEPDPVEPEPLGVVLPLLEPEPLEPEPVLPEPLVPDPLVPPLHVPPEVPLGFERVPLDESLPLLVRARSMHASRSCMLERFLHACIASAAVPPAPVPEPLLPEPLLPEPLVLPMLPLLPEPLLPEPLVPPMLPLLEPLLPPMLPLLLEPVPAPLTAEGLSCEDGPVAGVVRSVGCVGGVDGDAAVGGEALPGVVLCANETVEATARAATVASVLSFSFMVGLLQVG